MSDAIGALPEVAQLMARLCEIPSVSRHEQQMAAFVRERLAGIGMSVEEDDAADVIPAGCGNIVGRWPGTVPGTPIVFCAHLDTVPQDGPIEVVLDDDGFLTNRHPTILGGDNKSAVAAILVALRRVHAEGVPHAGLEVLFTPCEEISLRGATAFDPSRLAGRMCFVFDHSGPLGGIVTAGPSHRLVTATFRGLSAHAGLAVEEGRNAIQAAAAAIARMPLGRIDAGTTANVGVIDGGVANNVVPDRCRVVMEARSLDDAALVAQVTAMLDALTWAATEHDCDVEVDVRAQYHAFSLTDNDPQVAMAARALRACGFEAHHVRSGGGSDAAALLHNGFPAVNLCNDMIGIHTAGEKIAVETLEGTVDVILALVADARGPA